MSVNKVILLARLGKPVESRSLDNGNTVATFTVATSETWKDKKTGERAEDTQWHNIVTWGKTAEIAVKYLNKGDQVYLEGKLTHRSYEKDGTTKYITEVVVNNITLLGGNSNGTTSGNTQTNPEPAGVDSNGKSDNSDDLPF